jgi:2-polyprenyl-3-methyl-5-hydroxy-6-metoxy-1,4-benzoquinol methylase
MTYDVLKPRIVDYISPESNILILGCGNSSLSEDMYNDGYKFITNIDFSKSACNNMS